MARNILIQLLVFTLVFTVSTTQQAWGEQDCHLEKDMVQTECMISIIIIGDYVPPSNMCYPSDEISISAFKLVRVAEDCRKPLPAGTNCGSWTVLPPPSPQLPRAYP
ncbi:hypothetical protein SETIT_7G108600v2 [Setaria italica]|uniref:Bifunctional inhibitor/plant lipid transfer protein/seed storage helical domain-containing protein n=2 Tax=Setaria TaxID=4554 RepID=K3YE42_SETIT|nr:hypothetical protein SETIT_7G108600v2 [Setaria italica]TKW04530.1 hypothetical protein SEVIR_7G116400v2 [Setaria viridis]